MSVDLKSPERDLVNTPPIDKEVFDINAGLFYEDLLEQNEGDLRAGILSIDDEDVALIFMTEFVKKIEESGESDYLYSGNSASAAILGVIYERFGPNSSNHVHDEYSERLNLWLPVLDTIKMGKSFPSMLDCLISGRDYEEVSSANERLYYSRPRFEAAQDRFTKAWEKMRESRESFRFES